MTKEDRAYVLAFGVLASILALWLAGTITIGGVNLAEPYEHAPLSTERGDPLLDPSETQDGARGGNEPVGTTETGEILEDRDVPESLLLDRVGSAGAGPTPEDPLSLSSTQRLFWLPSKETLLHVYRSEAARAGLYDEERDLLLVDPLVVDLVWSEDKGLRAALSRACEVIHLGWEAWAEGRTDVVDALERDRVEAVAELWRYYSPAAYSAYSRATR